MFPYPLANLIRKKMTGPIFFFSAQKKCVPENDSNNNASPKIARDSSICEKHVVGSHEPPLSLKC